MNTKQVGNITEVQCMLKIMELGFNVLTPFGDCERYDFVVDIHGTFIRVQSKTSKAVDDSGDAFIFNTRSCNRKGGHIVHYKYDKSEIDYFATMFNGECYLIPVEECGATKRLRLHPAKNEQSRGVCFAENYKLEKMLLKI
jgi:hypothetical protein